MPPHEQLNAAAAVQATSPHHRATEKGEPLLRKGPIRKAIRLDDDPISMEVHGCVAAIVRLHLHAAVDGHGARIVGDRLASMLRQEPR